MAEITYACQYSDSLHMIQSKTHKDHGILRYKTVSAVW